MDIDIPKPSAVSGGAFFRRDKPKHTLRFFWFNHEGRKRLARRDVVHFGPAGTIPCQGSGCPICKEAADTNDRRLRAIERFGIIVIDMESDERQPKRYDAPSSVYSKLLVQIDEAGPEAILGNEGVDFTLKYDESQNPANKYQLIPKLKGSEVLDIDEDDIPDIMDDNFTADEDTESELEEQVCVFKDSRGREITGVLTPKKRGEKHVVEAEGRLWTVAPAKIISCEALGISGGEPVIEDASPDGVVNNKEIEVGVKIAATVEGEEVEGIVTKVTDDEITFEDDEYEYNVSKDEVEVVF